GPVDQGDLGVVGMLDQVFTGVPADLAGTEEQDVLCGNVRDVVQDISYRGKGHRGGPCGKFSLVFDPFAGLDHRIAQPLQKGGGHPVFTGPVETLFDLAYDFKVPQDLAVQAGTNPKHMGYGVLVLVHIAHLLEILYGALGSVTE